MFEVFAGEVVQVPCPHHDEPVQALALERLDEPLHVSVEIRRAVGQAGL